jgi:hypothetical protein
MCTQQQRGQKIPDTLRNKFLYCVHKSLLQDPILSQLSPVLNLISSFRKIRLNIELTSRLQLDLSTSVNFRFETKIFYVWWTLQIMNILAV